MKNYWTAALLTGLSLATGSIAYAHHSAAMFDPNKEVSVRGTVRKFTYSNPHCWIDVTVPGQGTKTIIWSVEGGSPATMRKAGIMPSTLKVGDTVTITMSPLRDGRPGGSLRTVKLANGKLVNAATVRSKLIGPPAADAKAPSF